LARESAAYWEPYPPRRCASLEVRDFKGVVTAVFRLKAKLWKARYPDVPLVIVRADGSEKRL
jgi:hypothetical protein